MASLSESSVFDIQVSLYENDVWLQKIPQQLHNFIEEKNRADSGLVITVFHDSFNKTTDDYVTLTMKFLNEKNDHGNSFVVAKMSHSYHNINSASNDSMVIIFIDAALAVSSAISLLKYILIIF